VNLRRSNWGRSQAVVNAFLGSEAPVSQIIIVYNFLISSGRRLKKFNVEEFQAILQVGVQSCVPSYMPGIVFCQLLQVCIPINVYDVYECFCFFD